MRDHHQQRSGAPVRSHTPLFPILKRLDAHAKQAGETLLVMTSEIANCSDDDTGRGASVPRLIALTYRESEPE
jgi:hypothetical protein